MTKIPTKWLACNEENVMALLSLKTPCLQSELARIMGTTSPVLSRIKNGHQPWHTIDQEKYKRALNELSNHKGINYVGGDVVSSDTRYLGLAELFDLKSFDIDYVIKNICGTYVSHRYSYRLHNKKYILRGMTTIFPNKKKDAIQTYEINCIQHEEGLNEQDPLFFRREGYFLYQRPMARMLSFKTDSSRDFQSVFFKEPLTAGAGSTPDRAHTMLGYILDWQRLESYFTPISLKRLNDNITPPIDNEVDQSIVKAIPETDPTLKAELADLKLELFLPHPNMASIKLF